MASPIFRCGHPRTPENTKISPSNPKGRCRKCRNAAIGAYRPIALERDGEQFAPDHPGWIAMCQMGSASLLAATARLIAKMGRAI